MNSRQTSKPKWRFYLAGAMFILAVLSWRFFPTPGVFLGNFFLEPLLRGESSIHKLLTKEPAAATPDQLAELTSLQAENERLRLFKEDEDILAGVIGRPTALPYDVLFIDKGSRDGVQVNAPVYAENDAAIGFVAAVYDENALVALLSTPGYVSTVYVYGPNIYTEAVGQGGGVTRIHVPQGVALAVGDPVVMPSLARGIYGSVSAVDSVPERPEQFGYMTSAIPLSSLRFVSVGKTPLKIMNFEEARASVDAARRDFLQVEVPPEAMIGLETGTTSSSTPEMIQESAPSTVE